MRARPSWRFWLLVAAGGLVEAGVAIALFLETRAWAAPVYLLAAVLVPLGLLRDRSLTSVPEPRRRGWALLGGALAVALSGLIIVVAFLVALTIACEEGC